MGDGEVQKAVDGIREIFGRELTLHVVYRKY